MGCRARVAALAIGGEFEQQPLPTAFQLRQKAVFRLKIKMNARKNKIVKQHAQDLMKTAATLGCAFSLEDSIDFNKQPLPQHERAIS